MDSLIPVVIIAVIVVVIMIALFLTTFCCIYKYHCKERAQKYRYQYSPLPHVEIELESHGSAHSSVSYGNSSEPCDAELGQLSSSLSSLSQNQLPGDHGEITDVQDVELGDQNLRIPHNVELKEQTTALPVINTVQDRELGQELTLPESIRTYIVNSLIPSFMDQRAGNQFAVVLLLSETDYQNINGLKLSPSDINGKPKIDNSQRALPLSTQYCNYIVARPTIREAIHSEREIFAIGSTNHSNKSRFNELWDAYCCQHNWVHPECILIYSWNLPCKNCTDLIVKSLQRSPYNSAAVIVAYTSEWREESIPQRQQNKERMLRTGIIVEEVKYHDFVKKLFAP